MIEDAGFSVVREYVGHGIGADLHEEPQIPNYGIPDGTAAETGMVLAIEPMVDRRRTVCEDSGGQLDSRHGGRIVVRAFRAYGCRYSRRL